MLHFFLEFQGGQHALSGGCLVQAEFPVQVFTMGMDGMPGQMDIIGNRLLRFALCNAFPDIKFPRRKPILIH